MNKELIICTSCGRKDMNNSFKNNEVIIHATIEKNDVSQDVSAIFTCQCAKCSKCGKILFTRMSKYKALKKEAEDYFVNLYGVPVKKFTSIELKK